MEENSLGGANYPWSTLATVLSSTFIVVLNLTVLNVALPDIGQSFEQADDVDLVVTVYLLSVGTIQLATGWLADRFGRERMLASSTALFTAASLGCGLAPSFEWLILARVVQGLGGGATLPLGQAIIYDAFRPQRRGFGMSLWGLGAMAVPAFGPPLGGWLTSVASWRWVFLMNIPVGIASTILILVVLRPTSSRIRSRPDLHGLIIGSCGLVALLLAAERAAGSSWLSLEVLVLLASGLALLLAFAVRQMRVANPIVRLEIFRWRTFRTSVGIVWMITAAQYSRHVIVPLELINVHGRDALTAGLMLTPAALIGAATMPLGGRLNDRYGPRLPVVTGCGLIAVSAFMLSRVSLSTSGTWIVTVLSINGIGTGLALMPNLTAAMDSVPPELLSQASGVRSVVRQVSAALSIAVLVSIVSGQAGGLDQQAASAAALQDAYNLAFLVASGVGFLAVILAMRLPSGRVANRELSTELSK